MPSLALISRAFADAFIAEDWDAPNLIRCARTVIGQPTASFVPHVVRRVLKAFRAPPDADVLAAFIATSPALQRAVGEGELRIVRPAVDAGPTPPLVDPALPSLPSVGDLAAWLGITRGDLDWFAQRYGAHVRRPATAPPTERWQGHYVTRLIDKRNGRYRLVEAPRPRLKALQRQIHRQLLVHIAASAYSHGFVRKRGPRTAVHDHCGKRLVLRFDLADFFTCVTRPRVQGAFRAMGYRTPVAAYLASLTTTTTASYLLADIPLGDTAGARRDRTALTQRLRVPHLPQGAPTSPLLANLVSRRLDHRLAGLANCAGAAYTRYADDLIFSGSEPFRGVAGGFARRVADIVRSEGFVLRADKTRYLPSGQQQRVVGLVVNERPNIDRQSYDLLKATLHRAKTKGPQTLLETCGLDSVEQLRAHLAGRIAWVAHISPRRAQKLLNDWRAIAWP